MRIFGIDPGLRCTGWGVVDYEGNHLGWVGDGVVAPDPDLPMSERVGAISREITELLGDYKPDLVAIEEVFMAKNAASAIKLGMARGAALVSVASLGTPLVELSARRIKQNVTGTGRADKAQVSAMVGRLLGVVPSGVDAADALAVAISAGQEKEPWAEGSTGHRGDAVSAAVAGQGKRP